MAKAAEEYASALFSLAKENGCVHEIQNSLDVISDVFRSEPEYVPLLMSPAVPVSERIGLIREAFGGAVHEYALSLLSIMCGRGEADIFHETASEYGKLLDRFTRRTTAYVTSAVSLTDDEKMRLREKLAKVCSSGDGIADADDIQLKCSTDKTLIGGIRIEIDGKILDGSLRSRLENAKEAIDV